MVEDDLVQDKNEPLKWI